MPGRSKPLGFANVACTCTLRVASVNDKVSAVRDLQRDARLLADHYHFLHAPARAHLAAPAAGQSSCKSD
jgi:GAF domain-containing protein